MLLFVECMKTFVWWYTVNKQSFIPDFSPQIYDFSAPQECPCTLVYHPTQQVFACGFETGSVRVFNVATTSMLAEHK